MIKNGYLLFILCLFFACQAKSPKSTSIDLSAADWNTIETEAKASTVHFMMWQGSPEINRYINDYVRPAVKEKYQIDLKITGGQGPEIVQLLMGEKQANVSSGQVDMVWINGETFFQLRQIDGLWGPFVDKLPNAEYINFEDPFIGIDFQQAIDGMECPWTVSQFAMVYDSAQVTTPPRNLDELESFVQNNPGKFTISNDFSGMTLLKSFLAELSGSPTGLNGPFDEKKYEQVSAQLWEYINRNKKYFWKEGKTFPKEQTKMDQMFANGEINLAFGFGEGSIEDKIEQGLFPTSTRAYAWDNGTIKNANYLGIGYNAKNKTGAMAVINFMISPEAQYKKADPKGMDANPVLDYSKLPEEWQKKYAERPQRKYGISMDSMRDKAIQEPDPRYMIKLYEDFRTQVLEK